MANMVSGSQLKEKQIKEKVEKYESFLNDKLRPDLKGVLAERDKIYSDVAEFLALKNSILAIRESNLAPGQPLKTRTDLGCNFYCQAVVEEPHKVFVDVGLGCFLEFSHQEALDFIERRTKLLEDAARLLTLESTKVKANIKLVLQGLRELQNIPDHDYSLAARRRQSAADA